MCKLQGHVGTAIQVLGLGWTGQIQTEARSAEVWICPEDARILVLDCLYKRKRLDRLSNRFKYFDMLSDFFQVNIFMITGHFSPAKRPVWLSNDLGFFYIFFADCFGVNIFLGHFFRLVC